MSSVTSTNPTSGGAAPETDDHLRARIQAAPNQFSVAGPAGAYRYFALGVDPSIIDAQVVSPAPGEVTVYVLTGPVSSQPATSPNNAGVAGATLLERIAAALSADAVRPLTDSVSVLAVTEVDYEINATLTLYADADPTATMAQANAAAEQFAMNLAAKVQRDIVPSQLVAALSVPGVYEVVLAAPVYTPLQVGQWANCTAINLTQTTSTEKS